MKVGEVVEIRAAAAAAQPVSAEIASEGEDDDGGNDFDEEDDSDAARIYALETEVEALSIRTNALEAAHQEELQRLKATHHKEVSSLRDDLAALRAKYDQVAIVTAPKRDSSSTKFDQSKDAEARSGSGKRVASTEPTSSQKEIKAYE